MAKVALLIGVSEYEPGLNALPAAVKDIEALRRVLQDPEMGGFDEVKTLANPEPHAMQLEIETVFEGRAKDDLVLLFFSGHGIKDDAGRLYFASRITRKNAKGDLIRSTAVPTSFVHDIMNNSRAKRQAIILDCCFSGAFDPALQAKDDGSVDLQNQLGAEGRVVLTSSSSIQYSFEQQGSDLSIYTRYLVEGIETGAGDTNSDGFVSMLKLHEYAASKVQETAPKMTPKIIVLKDKGFEIILAKARVTDPKLKYRKTASRYANVGAIRPSGRAVMDMLRQQLKLTLEEAAEIEAEVLRPYQERLANLKQYRETLVAEAEHEYLLSEFAHEDLNMFQQMLGLRDEDVLPIQQEVEAQFTQRSAAYQQSLIQYEQALTVMVQQSLSLSQENRQNLRSLQTSLGLRDEDATRIEHPLLQQVERRHQEKLTREAEQRRQEQEKAKHDNSLRRYEQKFSTAVQAEYPLNQATLSELKSFQQHLELKREDIVQIEQPIRQWAESYKRNELVIGIDLGTTTSVVSVMQGGKPIVIANAGGSRTTPSIVAYARQGDRLVGQIAKRQAVINPDNTFYSMNRFIGHHYDEVTNELKRVSYKVSNVGGNVKVDCPISGKQYAPEQIVAEVLRKLKDDASEYLGKPVTQAVITVPTYFNDSQRQATKDAGKIAGLEALWIINELTATLLAYGLDKKNNETVLVFHLGGGTFNVSVLEVNDGVFKVLTTIGDMHLGGDDFDKKIADCLAEEFCKAEGIDLREDKQAMQRLIEAAEKAKIELSSETRTEINLPFITATQDGPKHLDVTLIRDKFEEMCSNLIDRCRVLIEQALRDFKKDKNSINEVVLEGGSTRIPAIQELVRRILGKNPNQIINPDEVVAVGAAIQAGVLAG